MTNKSKISKHDVDKLFEIILGLKGIDDCYKFFEDICTINEIHALAERLKVARMLWEGKTYTEIEKETKASTTTISRISKCLESKDSGYRRVLGK